MKTKTYWQAFYLLDGALRWENLVPQDTRSLALQAAARLYEPGERWLLVVVELPDSEGGEEEGVQYQAFNDDRWWSSIDDAAALPGFTGRVYARRKPTPVPESRPAWEDITAEVRAMAEGAS